MHSNVTTDKSKLLSNALKITSFKISKTYYPMMYAVSLEFSEIYNSILLTISLGLVFMSQK